MVKNVAEYMQKHHMLENGDTVIVGVSGGADSVCLLSVLSKLQEDMELNIIVAHVNHMFRETAVRDEEFVQRLCKESDIPCEVKRADVASLAKEQGLSFEEAGRNIRYAFFEELLEKYDGDKIAVAHNKGDCAETMLFHLFRGSSLKGLGGIRPVNGVVIRPLLDVTRQEIEDYLTANQISWQTDETNESVEYARNYIRHEIMPLAEKLYAGAEERIADAATDLRDAEEYLEYKTKEAYLQYCNLQDGGVLIRDKIVSEEHTTIISRVLYQAIAVVGGTVRDIGKVHVQEVMNLFGLQSGRMISLPAGMVAYRIAEGIFIRRENDGGECATDRGADNSFCDGTPQTALGTGVSVALLSKEDLERGEEISFMLHNLGDVRARLLLNYELKNIPQKTYTKWFDYDKITKCPIFRKRTEGDFLTVNDEGGRKKLKEYFIQEKIPVYKRDETWVLADDNHIMWVPGYRISSFYKITEETKRVLEITIGGRTDGEN